MYTTRNIIAEDIQRRIEVLGDTKEGRFDIREVKRMVDNVCSELLKIGFYESRSDDDGKFNDPHWIATFESVDVARDGTRPFQRCYMDLPADYVVLPNNMGVFAIANVLDMIQMIPVPASFSDMNRGTGLMTMELRWSYEVVRHRVYFNERYDGKDLFEVAKEDLELPPEASFPPVRMNVQLLITSLEDTGDNDWYPIAPNMVEQLKDICIQRLFPSLQVPEDKRPKN